MLATQKSLLLPKAFGMSVDSVSPYGIAIAVLGCYILWTKAFKTKNARLPPGPKGLPIVGNLRDLPPPGVREWEHWLKHKDLYGPISSVKLFGMTIIVINDRQYAMDLLDKNSIKTMNRPKSVMAHDFAGFNKSISLVDLKTYRQYRKAISKVIGSRKAVSKFNTMQDVEAQRFLWRLLQTPKDFAAHLQTEAGAFILKMTYGYNVAPAGEDPLVAASENIVDLFANCAIPESWLVNIIPAMRYIPEWFPGGEFKRAGQKIAQEIAQFIAKPLAFTRFQKAQNSHDPSYASDLIDQGEDEDVIEWTAAAMYMAGADTTAATIRGAILAFLFYPEVQRKAQAEIDRVIGPDRLPILADRDNLPYIEAILMESHRWHTVAPMALTHMADEDIVYNNFLIPKGAAIMANSWFFNHDPDVHPNPEVFSPERFLTKDGHKPEPDPRDISFGYGRRICPGKYVADTAIFVTTAQILAAYNVSKAVGKNGQVIEPIKDPRPGFVSVLAPFECTFTPRSPKYVELIREVEKEHPFKFGDEEILAKAFRPN